MRQCLSAVDRSEDKRLPTSLSPRTSDARSGSLCSSLPRVKSLASRCPEVLFMAGSSWFRNFRRIVASADFCERRQLPSRDGNEEFSARESQYRLNRREFMAGAGKLAAGAAVGGLGPLARAVAAPPSKSAVTVGIVGAGLAGLACAYELNRRGIIATLFDADDRAGGRCRSLPGFFPGQVAELGGEFIDTPHKTLLGYIREFKLAVEDVDKQPGEVFYYFNGEHYPESRVVDEYRAFVPAMGNDLRTLSGEPTAADHTPADEMLDRTSLKQYLESRGARSAAQI